MGVTMAFEEVIIGDATLFLADCREVLPTLAKMDAVITDPPWGLGKLSGTISRKRNRNAYDGGYEDTEQNVKDFVVPAVMSAIAIALGRGLVSCGVPCLTFYPRPRAIGGFYQPAAAGMSPWGFAGFNPVLFYGKDPRDGKGQSNVMTTLTSRASSDGHPCAKPDRAMEWMVGKGSLPNHVVLDPFMGSGTTGVACVNLGRKFVGIEIERRYFDIACERIARAHAQGQLLPHDAAPLVEQAAMTLET